MNIDDELRQDLDEAEQHAFDHASALYKRARERGLPMAQSLTLEEDECEVMRRLDARETKQQG
jgi:hypothetical protein